MVEKRRERMRQRQTGTDRGGERSEVIEEIFELENE